MCCIDKRSSAELDESIRSMYRWYRDAKLCIVHLADTVSLVDIDKDQWFKRGWTLQELLAPTRIMYFTKEWQPLVSDGGENHKKDTDVVNAISEATGIPRYQLRYFKPGVNMIREKMSWARGRRTTKVEDVAYSLLGLFDLTMPIIYGEGEHAFQRLQTTLAGLTNSMDLFIWKDLQHLPTHNIFAPSPDFFPPPTAEENMRDDRFVLWIYSKVQSPKLSCNEHFSGGWTLRQCDTLARTFIHRGDLSFTLTNAGLHISLIMYQYTGFLDSSRGRLSEVNIRDARFAEAKPLDPIPVTPTTIPMFSGPGDRKIFVGVLDYDFGDANNEPIVSIEDIYVTQENDKLFIADIEEQDGGRSMIHEGREKRSYAAFLLRSLGLAVRGGSERFQKIGFLTVTRPKEGWKHREKVYVNLR